VFEFCIQILNPVGDTNAFWIFTIRFFNFIDELLILFLICPQGFLNSIQILQLPIPLIKVLYHRVCLTIDPILKDHFTNLLVDVQTLENLFIELEYIVLDDLGAILWSLESEFGNWQLSMQVDNSTQNWISLIKEPEKNELLVFGQISEYINLVYE